MARLGSRRILLIAVLATAPGCEVFHDYQPVTILVRDGETKRPIANAEISVQYLSMLDPFSPPPSSTKTGEDGLAVLKLDVNGSRPIHQKVVASGYLNQDGAFWLDIKNTLRDRKKGQPDSIVELFMDPNVTIELTVPDGFRGMIRVNLKALNDKPWTPGQRSFALAVPKSGLAEIELPSPLIRSLWSSEFHARYANGKALGRAIKDEDFGLRWLSVHGNADFFVIGTADDLEECRSLVYRRISPGTITFDEAKVDAWVERQRAIK